MMPSDEKAKRIEGWLRQSEHSVKHLMFKVADERALSELESVARNLASAIREIREPKPNDSRSYARHPENALLVLRSEKGEQIEAVLHDVSLGGLLIEGAQTLNADEIYQVLIPGVDEPVRARAIATVAGLTRIGFKDLTPQQAIALLKHVERDFARS